MLCLAPDYNFGKNTVWIFWQLFIHIWISEILKIPVLLKEYYFPDTTTLQMTIDQSYRTATKFSGMTLSAFIITAKFQLKFLSAKSLLPMISMQWTLYNSAFQTFLVVEPSVNCT